MWGERKILNRRKPDLRGGKRASDMVIEQYTQNHTGYYFYLSEHYQMERAGWMKKGCFHSAMSN